MHLPPSGLDSVLEASCKVQLAHAPTATTDRALNILLMFVQRLGFEASCRAIPLQHPDGVYSQMPFRRFAAEHLSRRVEVYVP